VEDQAALRELVAHTRDSVYTSGLTGDGVSHLAQRIEEVLGRRLKRVRLKIPYSRGDLVNHCYARGRVHGREDAEEGILLDAEMPMDLAGKLSSFIISPDTAASLDPASAPSAAA